MLWCIVRGKSALGALLLEESIEGSACELAAVVGSKTFDVGTTLSAGPSCKGLVGCKGLVLGMKQLDVHVVQIIVCEGHIILLTSNTLHWRWSPNV